MNIFLPNEGILWHKRCKQHVAPSLCSAKKDIVGEVVFKQINTMPSQEKDKEELIKFMFRVLKESVKYFCNNRLFIHWCLWTSHPSNHKHLPISSNSDHFFWVQVIKMDLAFIIIKNLYEMHCFCLVAAASVQ